jgi:hypothetical protein
LIRARKAKCAACIAALRGIDVHADGQLPWNRRRLILSSSRPGSTRSAPSGIPQRKPHLRCESGVKENWSSRLRARLRARSIGQIWARNLPQRPQVSGLCLHWARGNRRDEPGPIRPTWRKSRTGLVTRTSPWPAFTTGANCGLKHSPIFQPQLFEVMKL